MPETRTEASIAENSLGRLNARLDRLCPTKTWTLAGFAAEVIHRTSATTLDELAAGLRIEVHYDAGTSFALGDGFNGRPAVFVKDRNDRAYMAALVAAVLYGIERRPWQTNTPDRTWTLYREIGDALLAALPGEVTGEQRGRD